MSDKPTTPVAELNKISLGTGGTAGVTPTTPKPRTISWTLSPVWKVGDIIEATNIAVTAGPANAAQTAPSKVKQVKGGVDVVVTAVAPAADGFAEATKSETVKVEKIKPKITWKTPMPVKKGHKLSADQQDAETTPTGLKLTYTPAPNDEMKKTGDIALKVAFVADDSHEAAAASVTLTVVDGDEALATAQGRIGMQSGRAFNFRTKTSDPVNGEHVQGALDNWAKSDPNDPLSMKVQGQKIMADVQKKKPAELIAYMDELVKGGKGQYKLADTKSDGKKAEYPNMIWILPNGLQIRFKPRGDGQGGLTDPMFCVEGRRTDVTTFGGEPEQSAFKLMANGEPAPVGPSDTSLPSFGTGPTEKTLNRMAMNEACKTTHLYCPVEAQTLTWTGPHAINHGDPLTATHLNATGLGGAVPYYVITDYVVTKALKGPPYVSDKVTIGTVLARGVRKIEARCDPVGNYKGGRSSTVVFTVTAP